MRCDGLPSCEHCRENAELRRIHEEENFRKEQANYKLHDALTDFARAYNISLADAADAVKATYENRYMPDELGKQGERQFDGYNK